MVRLYISSTRKSLASLIHTMYATADFSVPHCSTGKPLKRMNPRPSMISRRWVSRKPERRGRGKLSYHIDNMSNQPFLPAGCATAQQYNTFEMSVSRVPAPLNASAARLNSPSSWSVNRWVHAPGLALYCSDVHTVGPETSGGKASYGFNS